MGWRRESACDGVAIIGLGQIGSSMGLAIRSAGLAGVVTGYDLSPLVGSEALSMGAVDRLAGSPEEAARGADLIIMAVPVGEMDSLIPRVAEHMSPDALLTDTGSAKTGVVEMMDRWLGPGGRYIGGHPMAGTEMGGPGAASAALIRGCLYVLCPGPRTAPDALSRARSFLESLPVRVSVMSPADHDRRAGWISHLPYMAAVGLCLAIAQGVVGDPVAMKMASGSYRDGTRTAVSDPVMAGDYCLANRTHLIESIRSLKESLDDLVEVLDAGDQSSLRNLLARARAFRVVAGHQMSEEGI